MSECSDYVWERRVRADCIGGGVQGEVSSLVGAVLRSKNEKSKQVWGFECLYLGAEEWGNGKVVEGSQHNDEECNQNEVFIPSLKFPANLKQGGYGSGADESHDVSERQCEDHFGYCAGR